MRTLGIALPEKGTATGTVGGLLDVRFGHLVGAIEEGQTDAVRHRTDPHDRRVVAQVSTKTHEQQYHRTSQTRRPVRAVYRHERGLQRLHMIH